jgi:phosphoglycerate dehydrogenase-like enzyme
MPMLRCVVLDDYQNVALKFGDWAKLKDRVDPQIVTEHIADRERLVATLDAAAIVIAMRERTPFDPALLERLPDLKLLVTTGMRNAAIDLAAATARGITVCGTESSAGATAELTWGLILALMRYIPREAAGMRDGKWQRTVGREVAGRRLGVIGLGRLGARVAKVGLTFGMQVAAWSQNLTPERCKEIGVDHAGSLEGLLRSADVVTIHLVLSERTRGLIKTRELELMKHEAILINTSRGPIIDEQALVNALQAQRIAGAALDVYDREPLPVDHALRSLDNAIATPHLGYVTEEGYRLFYGQAVDDIAAWLDGNPVRVLRP